MTLYMVEQEEMRNLVGLKKKFCHIEMETITGF